MILSVCFLLAGCSSSPSPTTHARLVPPVTGTILVNEKDAKAGDPLKDGDTVIARGDDAQVSIKWEDGTVVNIYGLGAPNSESKLVVASYDPSTKGMVLRLLGGVISLISPPKNPPPRKTVEALNTTTATVGTEFVVKSSPDGDTVSLGRGQVQVTQNDGGAVRNLTPGQQIEVKPGVEPGQPTPYDANSASEKKFFIAPGEDVEKGF